MSRSELNTVMVGGFATVAGGVLAAYVGMLSGWFPGIAAHLLAASVMNAPAGLAISKILVPETAEGRAHAAGLREAEAAMKAAEPIPPRKRLFQFGGHSGESGMIEAAAAKEREKASGITLDDLELDL